MLKDHIKEKEGKKLNDKSKPILLFMLQKAIENFTTTNLCSLIDAFKWSGGKQENVIN